MDQIKLGDKVREPISKISGIVVAMTQYLTGCERCSVQQEGINKITGKPYEWLSFDVPALELIVPKKIIRKPTNNGGPKEDVSRKI